MKLNMTRAVAARTIRDEILEPVPDSQGRQMQVTQTPVIPGSLILEVDDGSFESPLDLPRPTSAGQQRRWNAAERVSLEDETAPAFGRRWTQVDDCLITAATTRFTH